MPFIPHTPADVQAMLAAIGAPNLEALFDEIPPALWIGELPALPEAPNELQVRRLLEGRGRTHPVCCVSRGGIEL